MVFHDVFTNGKQVHKARTHLSWESPRVIPTKSFHTARSSMASLVSLVLSSPVSALVVSIYVVLGLPPFWQPGNKDVLPVVAFLPLFDDVRNERFMDFVLFFNLKYRYENLIQSHLPQREALSLSPLCENNNNNNNNNNIIIIVIIILLSSSLLNIYCACTIQIYS